MARTRSGMRVPLEPEQFAALRERRQRGIMEVANDLHEAGFPTVMVESQTIGTEDYWVRVVIPDSDIYPERFDKVMEVAKKHDASVALSDHYSGSPQLVLWPLFTE